MKGLSRPLGPARFMPLQESAQHGESDENARGESEEPPITHGQEREGHGEEEYIGDEGAGHGALECSMRVHSSSSVLVAIGLLFYQGGRDASRLSLTYSMFKDTMGEKLSTHCPREGSNTMENNPIREIRAENLSLVTAWKQMREGALSHDTGSAIMESILEEKSADELRDMVILLASQMAEAMEYLEEEMGEPELYREYCAMANEPRS